MPLIVICGQPGSGKSIVASKLVEVLQGLRHEVHVIDEPSLHLERNKAYQALPDEKNTRSKLKSAVERLLTKKRVVILDSLNNIKGYRYELWCIARACGTRYCMVHVDTPVEQCREWNAAREGDKYSDAVFNDIASRFERPDARNRWDAPLFTLHPAAKKLEEPPAPEPAGAGLPPPEEVIEDKENEDAVLQAICRAVVDVEPQPGAQEQQQQQQQAVSRELQPTLATNNVALLGTNVLHDIDNAAQDVIDVISEASSAAVGTAPGLVHFGDGLVPLQLDRPVTLAELRRHKRAFIKLATKVTFARLQDPQAAKRLFIDYLRDNLRTGWS